MIEITDEFHVAAPPGEAWDALLDIERVARCMPGVALLEVEDRGARGRLKVRIGPVSAQYEGTARITAVDDRARHATVEGEGRDTKGQGRATARIEIAVTESPGDTATVAVSSRLQFTGRFAQFGRGVIEDVSRSLMAEFASRLRAEVTTGPSKAAPGVRSSHPDEAVHLVSVAVRPIVNRVAPLALVALAVALTAWLLDRRRTRRRPDTRSEQ